MKALDTPSTAPRVENPQTFFYFVSNLIKSELVDTGLKENLSHDTLLEFLGTTQKEIKQFEKTNLLPASWLEKISQTDEGIEVLEIFDLRGYISDPLHESKHVDFGKPPETPKKQKIEGHTNPTKRNLLRENGAERLSDDDIEKYLASLEKLKSELATDKEIGEIIADFKSPKGEDMNVASSGMQAAAPKMTLGTVTVTTQNKPNPTIDVARKVLFPKKEFRDKFLEDLRFFLQANKKVFDLEIKRDEQENFKKTGIIPPKKIELILKEEGGAEFLASWEKEVTIEYLKPPLIERGRKPEEELVPKDKVSHAFYVMKKLTGKSNRELAGILGISKNTLNAMPRGNARLHNCQVDYLANWLGIPKEEFFYRIRNEIPPKKTEKAMPDKNDIGSEETPVETEATLNILVTDYEKWQLNGNVREKMEPPKQEQRELDEDSDDEEKQRILEKKCDSLSAKEKARGITALFAEKIVKELSNANGITEKSVKERGETMTENKASNEDSVKNEEGNEKLEMEISVDFPKELPRIIEALLLAADAAGGPSQEDQRGIFLGYLRASLSDYIVTFSKKADAKFVCFRRRSDGSFFEFNVRKLRYI